MTDTAQPIIAATQAAVQQGPSLLTILGLTLTHLFTTAFGWLLASKKLPTDQQVQTVLKDAQAIAPAAELALNLVGKPAAAQIVEQVARLADSHTAANQQLQAVQPGTSPVQVQAAADTHQATLQALQAGTALIQAITPPMK